MSFDIHIPRIKEKIFRGIKFGAGMGGIVQSIQAFKGRATKNSATPEKYQALMRATGQVIEEFASKQACDDWFEDHGARLYNLRHIPAQNETFHETPGSRHELLAHPISNLILNNGLDLKGKTDNFVFSSSIGTGTTTPAVTQSALTNRTRGSDTLMQAASAAKGSAPYYGYLTMIYRYDPPGSNHNYTELGFHPSGGSTNLFSRVLTEVVGVPTAISVDADEYLDVTYELRMYPYAITQDVDGGTVDGYDLTYGAVDLDFVSPMGWGSEVQQSMGGISSSTKGTGHASAYFDGATESLAGTGLGYWSNNPTFQAYTDATYSRTYDYSIGINDLNGNLDGIVMYTSLGRYAFITDPYIPKTINDSLGFSVDFSWDRHTI